MPVPSIALLFPNRTFGPQQNTTAAFYPTTYPQSPETSETDSTNSTNGNRQTDKPTNRLGDWGTAFGRLIGSSHHISYPIISSPSDGRGKGEEEGDPETPSPSPFPLPLCETLWPRQCVFWKVFQGRAYALMPTRPSSQPTFVLVGPGGVGGGDGEMKMDDMTPCLVMYYSGGRYSGLLPYCFPYTIGCCVILLLCYVCVWWPFVHSSSSHYMA